MNLDFSRCRLSPFQHQREDVEWIIERPFAFIASECRTGKTKIVIDAAQFLFEAGTIDRVVVVAPAPVRDVWADRTLGEIAKHSWLDVPATVTEFHARVRTWLHAGDAPAERKLDWYVTNFEFIRSKNRLAQLMSVCGPRTMLVLDESSFVKNHAAQQTKACLQLRRACGRVVLLNGTPVFHSPLDLFSQGNILHPSILQCPYVTHFKARYAVQEAVLTHGGRALLDPYGRRVQRIASWTNLDDLQRRFAPVTVRRLQRDCLDLPPKLDPVTLTATLTPETWRAYRDMRDELVVWLRSGEVATSATAAVKALRLSQITGGFLGGIEEAGIDERVEDGLLESLQLGGHDGRGNVRRGMGEIFQEESGGKAGRRINNGSVPFAGEQLSANGPLGRDPGGTKEPQRMDALVVQEIGREKLDVLLWFIAQRLEADPCLHLVAWCRFRAELLRVVDAVRERFPLFEVGVVMGGQKKADRLAALALLKPETSPAGPVFVGGIEGTGSFGLDMCAAHTCVTMSSGYSPGRSAQTLDRVYGPGQKYPIAYYDVVAVGPRGQRTIDHAIVEARRAGKDVAEFTASHWIKVLTEE